jgi:hypothetical protein
VHIEEAARLLRLIQKDPESHVVGAFLNWKYVPTGAERAAWDIKELDLNANRGKGKLPIKLPRPWQGEKDVPTPDMVPVDSPERTTALERLKSLS